MSIWVLRLNDMRMVNIENSRDICRAGSQAELEAFVAREAVPRYKDEDLGRTWGKEFRKGGPLEWYNPPFGASFGQGYIEIPDRQDWLRISERNWDAQIGGLPVVDDL